MLEKTVQIEISVLEDELKVLVESGLLPPDYDRYGEEHEKECVYIAVNEILSDYFDLRCK